MLKFQDLIFKRETYNCMRLRSLVKGVLITVLVCTFNQVKAIELANPNTTPEARALLDIFLQDFG